MSADKIATALEADILGGAFRPGEELKQGDIASRFSVSRIPVRDALQLLASRGLIELEPNRRARVISLSAAEIAEVFDLRVLLETDCLKQAIPNMSAADFKRIASALAHSNIDATGDLWAEGDWAFHRALYLPARRPRQLAMIEELRRTCRIHISGYGILPSRTGDWLKDHEELVETCRNGDVNAAAALLQRHIENARQTLLAALPAGPED
ncbi:GntR family transcriptional regulator [Roseibium sediminicola]|uniref:GntR family transcriptional regulator n=1 Tax=Roseibium sediminicola TaxID=2933272 RepID=A0ABT0GV47_9HYPH|nr:GntR family transcriptional regulator [Roseibium sp. CAU 1639]MCK7613306.1 GntR family transcriptional regulator [Roseibium sp. CAU 1639]